MTREEVQDLLAMITVVFPNFKPVNRTASVNAWESFFREFPNDKVVKAFKIFCTSDTSGFPPTIAQIIKIMQEMDGTIGELEAWAMVRKATSNGIYHAEEEYAKLPDVIKLAVGNPENIRAWAMKDTDEVETVIMSQFLKAYKTAQERMARAAVFSELKPQIESKEPEVIAIEDKEPQRRSQEAINSLYEQTVKKLGGVL